jgi:hypothetical protein
MHPFLFRKAREQLRYDGGIEPSCAWRWFLFNSLSAIMFSCMMRDGFF